MFSNRRRVAHLAGLIGVLLVGAPLELIMRKSWVVMLGAIAGYAAGYWFVLRRWKDSYPNDIDRRSYDERFGPRWWRR